MERKQHHIQDALEHYAVAVLQGLAERSGVAISADSNLKMEEFRKYAKERNLTDQDFDSGRWAAYKSSYDRHFPVFVDRLTQSEALRGRRMDFLYVEARSRSANKKGDFDIVTSSGQILSVSLKNYQRDARRVQLSSGTFNSFALGFLFDGEGVGMYIDPASGGRFKGSTISKRDSVLDANGYGKIIGPVHQMDELNRRIKRQFVESPEFAYRPETTVWRLACKECGEEGVRLALQILELIGHDRIKARLLKMTGLDGIEDILMLDPYRFADSITVPAFHKLRTAVQAPETRIVYGQHGKSIRFDFTSDGAVILSVDVPFTINSNGAWVSGDRYEGVHYYKKDNMYLAWGQRRPRKCKELATSINTYVDFSKAGIFVEASL